MHLGYSLPLGDVGGDPATVREFAARAMELRYADIVLPDHVLGVDPGLLSADGRPKASNLYHDPFVLFAFLAGIAPGMHFSTQVLILPQRQTALVAKQAACLAVLCEGRFRLGVGVGWNEAEFIGLGENFRNRGRRSVEQVEVMQKLWAEPFIDYKGQWHTLPHVGINPRPPGGQIPVWFGGHVPETLARIARLGDGWMQLALPPGPEMAEQWDTIRRLAEQAGRDPARIGLEVWVSCAEGEERDWQAEARRWQAAGATRICLHNTFTNPVHKRVRETDKASHLEYMRRWRQAMGEVFGA
jgi:probable F420-dependent oxidoreductase